MAAIIKKKKKKEKNTLPPKEQKLQIIFVSSVAKTLRYFFYKRLEVIMN